jgi:rhodanese-related sulfurtransferase
MSSQKPFKQTLTEAGSIVLLATALGLVYNALSSRGIALVREVKKISLSFDTTKVTTLDAYVEPILINLEDAQKFYESGDALFIDARHDEDYAQGHIKGAMSLPLDDLEKNPALVNNIPKDKLLVAYCGGAECALSTDLAKKLASMGFTNVKVFFGGWPEWQAKNLPIDKGPKGSSL